MGKALFSEYKLFEGVRPEGREEKSKIKSNKEESSYEFIAQEVYAVGLCGVGLDVTVGVSWK